MRTDPVWSGAEEKRADRQVSRPFATTAKPKDERMLALYDLMRSLLPGSVVASVCSPSYVS